jgi:hypothetical protein
MVDNGTRHDTISVLCIPAVQATLSTDAPSPLFLVSQSVVAEFLADGFDDEAQVFRWQFLNVSAIIYGDALAQNGQHRLDVTA